MYLCYDLIKLNIGKIFGIIGLETKSDYVDLATKTFIYLYNCCNDFKDDNQPLSEYFILMDGTYAMPLKIDLDTLTDVLEDLYKANLVLKNRMWLMDYKYGGRTEYFDEYGINERQLKIDLDF